MFSRVLTFVLNQVNRIIIVDNNSKNIHEIKRLIESYKKIFLLENRKNLGIGYALNKAIRQITLEDSPDWILTLDQDTIIMQNAINRVLREYEKLGSPNKVGILVLSQFSTDGPPFKELDYAMTSGSLVKTEIYKKIKYREGFFLDQIDFDFSYEVRRIGYRILSYNLKHLIEHHLGSNILRGKIVIKSYEPNYRYYYIVRNSTILLLEKKISIPFYANQLRNVLKKLLLVEGIRPSLSALMYGLKDGLSKKTGYSEKFCPKN